jgi:hypothetical protein
MKTDDRTGFVLALCALAGQAGRLPYVAGSGRQREWWLSYL